MGLVLARPELVFSAEVIHQAQGYTDRVGYGAYVAVHWRRGYTADMPLRSIEVLLTAITSPAFRPDVTG